jgi:hypothetical protein
MGRNQFFKTLAERNGFELLVGMVVEGGFEPPTFML